eukprot:gene15593-15740_t
MTGVYDEAPIQEQANLIKEILSFKDHPLTIGILYNPGEANSVTTTEVSTAAKSLVNKVDAIYIPNDNTLISALDAVLKVSQEHKIPVFSSDPESSFKSLNILPSIKPDKASWMNWLKLIIQKFVGQKADIIVAIPTTPAQAAAQITQGSKIPVVFASVTDPVGTKLVIDPQKPEGNITGLKRLGIIYNPGEANSVILLEKTQSAAKDEGINLVAIPASKTSEVLTAAQNLIGKIDAIFINNDNTALAAFDAVTKENQIILDVAGGTGDIAIGIQKAYPHLDLDVMGILHNLHWCNGNAESLPIPDQSIDIYTIVFGLRNVADKEKALLEAFRAYDTYSFNVLPLLGKYVAKDQDAYQYLVESIRQFPDQQTLINKMDAAGFTKTAFENWWGGIAALHWGTS